MKVFIDTNILISAMLYKNSLVSIVYDKIVSNCECYISNKTISELYGVFYRKFPEQVDILKIAINMMTKTIKLVDDTEVSYPLENTIRDKKDIYIYRNAKYLGCDAIITGDKDFLENKQLDIRVLSPKEILNEIR